MSRPYETRYSVEPWGKPVPPHIKTEKVAEGIRVVDGKYGYTDWLFLVSVLHDGNGDIESVLMFDSESGPNLSQKTIDLVRSQLDHYEKEHLGK